MRDPRPGTVRHQVYRAMAGFTDPIVPSQIKEALLGKVDPEQVDMAISTGVKQRDIVRFGDTKPYSYRLCERLHPRAAELAREAEKAYVRSDNLSPSVGLVCGPQAIPQNRSQGTIEEALAAILTDRPQSIDEIFVALPIGWSRADAVAGLKEAVLAEWAKCEARGWVLVGEPPEPSAAPVEAPVSHMGERLQAVRSGLGELLRDAVRLQDAPPLIRCIANAYAEVDAAVGMTKA